MKQAVPIAASVIAVAAAVALGGEAQPDPAPAPRVEAVTPAMLRAQLTRERRVHRVQVGKLRAALRATRSRPDYIWWSTGDTRRTAEAVWDEQGVSASERRYWACIIGRESGWRPDVWYGGAHGWQPQYAGTDRVVGLLQMRPYHADIGERVVSHRTYVRLTDPVFALRKALRLGHRPFFASNGGCR